LGTGLQGLTIGEMKGNLVLLAIKMRRGLQTDVRRQPQLADGVLKTPFMLA
jgi:hypothetical protein